MANQLPRDNAMYNIGETMNLKKNDKKIMARKEKSHVFGSRLMTNDFSRQKLQINSEISKEELSRIVWKDIKIPLRDRRLASSLH